MVHDDGDVDRTTHPAFAVNKHLPKSTEKDQNDTVDPRDLVIDYLPPLSIPQFGERVPQGVVQILSRGACNVGKLNGNLVLKYASDPNNPAYLMSIKVEARLLEVLGKHPHVVESLGLQDDGLMLKYYPNGTLRDYISLHPFLDIDQRLEWCRQLADTVVFVHSNWVIHCDITLCNILLDEELNLVLADFQGLLYSSNGVVLLDGLSRAPAKSSMPRANFLHADVRTDIFAVGSAMYHIIVGNDVFPELNSYDDQIEITDRFRKGMFPMSNYIASNIVEKCWRGEYWCAATISADIAAIQAMSREVLEDQMHGVEFSAAIAEAQAVEKAVEEARMHAAEVSVDMEEALGLKDFDWLRTRGAHLTAAIAGSRPRMHGRQDLADVTEVQTAEKGVEGAQMHGTEVSVDTAEVPGSKAVDWRETRGGALTAAIAGLRPWRHGRQVFADAISVVVEGSQVHDAEVSAVVAEVPASKAGEADQMDGADL
jgi:hypothetical protein